MSTPKEIAKPGSELDRHFRAANVHVEELESCKSNRAKAIKIGQFLGPVVGREVPIQVKGRTGKAILKSLDGRSGQKLYYAEIRWDRQQGSESSPATMPKMPAANMTPGGEPRQAAKKTGGKTQTAQERETNEQGRRPTQPAAKDKLKVTTPTRTKAKPDAAGNVEKW